MAKRRKIKVVIFDLGGVIVHGGYLDFIRHYLRGALSGRGKKQIARLEREVNLGLITEREFYTALERVFDVHLTPKQMHAVIVKKMRADKGLLHFIPKLQRGKVALFTNTIGHMGSEVLRRRRISSRKLFSHVFQSYIIHHAKPDRGAYQYILHKLRVRPHEALMVDDRPENIRGARRAGMNGIVYKNSRQFRKTFKNYELV